MKLITLYWGRLVCNSSWSIKWRKNNDICHEFAFVRLQAKLQFIVLIKTSFYTLLQMIYWSNHLLMCTTNSFMCFMGKYGTLCRETCKKRQVSAITWRATNAHAQNGGQIRAKKVEDHIWSARKRRSNEWLYYMYGIFWDRRMAKVILAVKGYLKSMWSHIECHLNERKLLYSYFWVIFCTVHYDILLPFITTSFHIMISIVHDHFVFQFTLDFEIDAKFECVY